MQLLVRPATPASNLAGVRRRLRAPAALRTLAAGGDIDYEGASGTIDWDQNGDLRRGHIGIWRFTEDEQIEDVRAVAFEDG